MVNINNILEENIRRNNVLDAPYDHILGIGSPLERQEISFADWENPINIPISMANVEWVQNMSQYQSIYDIAKATKTSSDIINEAFIKERFKHDFEFWAGETISIEDKDTFRSVPFILRQAQLKLLNALETMRLNGVSIRIVLLKARQWGGSTLVQIYMMWIQQIHKKNWHLVVCAQDDATAAHVSGMYDYAIKEYPLPIGEFKPFKGLKKVRIDNKRGGRINIGSINNPEQFRGKNNAMCHLSEVGIWKDTPERQAKSLIKSLIESVPDEAYTIVVEESTAKGINYFYDSWKNAVGGKTAYKAVFVPWQEIDRCRRTLQVPPAEFIRNMTEYDWFLWEQGATLEGINWYNKHKADNKYDDWEMQQENPTTPEEAFQSAGQKVFNKRYIEAMEEDCRPPELIGTITATASIGAKAFKNIEFVKQNNGNLHIWSLPDKITKVRDRYCAYADIGGSTKNADYSVLKVIDRYWMIEGGNPEVVAVWYGHLDKDLFGWVAAQICSFYNNALLAIETNSIDKDKRYDENFLTVIDKVAKHYPNLYIRNEIEKVGDGYIPKYGFHMNKKTKPMIISALHEASRNRFLMNENKKEDEAYALIERDIRAVKEMKWFERKADGSMGAIKGQKDDHVDTTAGAFWLALDMPLPVIIKPRKRRKNINSMANF